ncbi:MULTISPECIES: sensor histidine kinase [unclassified Corallococcus]|uniref:sensor histidine kinase n=1 Tax=unclassified Corallococcus TaxID=2685029 RepID=UPI001CC133F7|nr:MULTISPECIES: sensor histidine kinase [unclassified Corallococcus]MBZ4334457.1 sensor histidine kinase [Corallococcus sp. AS-1-12]MBZ4374620.1 sensor histidine kinase [Corallococcus sp. AS-1-6]
MLRIRLRAKLTLGVCLVLVPLLGLLLLGIEEGYEMRRASLLNSMGQTATMAGLLIDASLGDAMRLAETLAVGAAGQDLRAGEFRRSLADLVRLREDLLNVAVFDVSGQPITSAMPWPETAEGILDRPYFQHVLQTKEAGVSPLIVGRRTKQPTVIAAAPILDATRKLVGVVTVSLRLDRVSQRMLDIELRPGQALFVTDSLGRLVLHTGRLESSWPERDLSGMPRIQEALSAGTPVLTTDFQGIFLKDSRIAALVPTPRQGWLVGVTWGTQEAFEELAGVRRLQLAAFTAIALLVLAGAYTLAAYLSGRASRLVEHARALGRGEWTPIPPSRLGTGDELDELTHAFNHMAAELKSERERRERFISAVAHDLKNLITPLTLATQLLGSPSRQTPEARERMLARLGRQTAGIERLVSDLLDVSRLQTGHFTLFRQPSDVAKVVRDVLEEQQEGAAGHVLVYEGPEHLGAEIDPDRVGQVLTNLVGNGIKYSPEGGTVTVALSQTADTVDLRVVDQGIGLQPQELQEVFAPYSRAVEARSIRGLGLGLYICRAIVEAHGGTIEARSEGRGRGTTFLVSLPRHPPGGAAT